MKNRIPYWAAPSLWAALIVALHGIPGKDLPQVNFLALLAFDKWVHAGLFAVFAWLLLRACYINGLKEKKYTALTLAVCILFGAVLELLQQTLFSERTADVLDLIADSFGAVVGVLFFKKWKGYSKA